MIQILINSYSYNNKISVLKNIQFSLNPGKITSFIGPSGCGKSTLLRVLMGIETGANGNISIANFNHNLNNWRSNQRVFSMVPQVPHLFPWKTILENIIIAITKDKSEMEDKSKKEIALHALEIVQMEDHAQKYPDEISLGMAQRISFARALVLDTKAILLDEPFASLDAHTRFLLQDWLLQKIEETNKYAILVTHDFNEAIKLSNNIHILFGNPAEISKTYHCLNGSFENQKEIEKEIILTLGSKLMNSSEQIN